MQAAAGEKKGNFMALHLNANSPIYCRFVHKALIYSDGGGKKASKCIRKKDKETFRADFMHHCNIFTKGYGDDDTPFFCAN